jgi:hypothetical protein
VPGYSDPQNFNRYSYVTNNPLKYRDPSGRFKKDTIEKMGIYKDDVPIVIYEMLRNNQIDDKLVVTYSKGGAQEYRFTKDSKPNIVLQNNKGTLVEASSVLVDQEIKEIRVWRPSSVNDPPSLNPEIRNGYHLT